MCLQVRSQAELSSTWGGTLWICLVVSPCMILPKLGQYFSHPSLVFYHLLPTPSIKLKLGLQIGGRLLLIATHLDNRSLALLCYQPQHPEPKPFCWPKPICFDFSSSSILLQGHILVGTCAPALSMKWPGIEAHILKVKRLLTVSWAPTPVFFSRILTSWNCASAKITCQHTCLRV